MNFKNIQLNFFLTLFVGVLVLVFFVFGRFLYVIAFAMVFGVLFKPLFRRFRKLVKSDGLAALLTELTVLVLFLLPLTFLGIQIFNELGDLYSHLLQTGGSGSVSTTVKHILVSGFQKIIPGFNASLINNLDFNSYVQGV